MVGQGELDFDICCGIHSF